MAADHLLIALGCLSGFACTFLVALAAHGAYSGLSRSVRIQQRAGSAGALAVLQTGVPALLGMSVRLLRIGRVRRFAEQACNAARQNGVAASPDALLSLVAFACLALLAVCALVGRAPLGVLLGAGVVLGVGAASAHALELRYERTRDALPDALQSMSSCFGAGYTLLQTFDHLAEELKGPLSGIFRNAANAMRMGTPPLTALAQIRDHGGVAELSFVSVALAVQHQTGGSMQRVLDATRDSLKQELELRRSLRVHTAQAKLSARVVVGVTIGLVAAMMLLSRDFLQPFFSSTVGMVLLGVAVFMQVAGVVLVRRLLGVEVS